MKELFLALAAAGMLAGCAVSRDETAHHSASELEVRAGDHCDCNRALPGSAQSAVRVPEVDR